MKTESERWQAVRRPPTLLVHPHPFCGHQITLIQYLQDRSECTNTSLSFGRQIWGSLHCTPWDQKYPHHWSLPCNFTVSFHAASTNFYEHIYINFMNKCIYILNLLWMSVDPWLTEKVCSFINTVGPCRLMMYSKDSFIPITPGVPTDVQQTAKIHSFIKYQGSSQTQGISGTKFKMTYSEGSCLGHRPAEELKWQSASIGYYRLVMSCVYCIRKLQYISYLSS